MKKKIIILFIVLLGLSWFFSISTMLGNPKEMQSHIEKAEALDEKGIYVEAIEEYQEALTYKADDVDTIMKIAHDYLLIDETKKYTNTLMQAVELQKDGSEEALNELMNYYIDEEQEDKAARYIRDYSAKAPDVEYAQKWFVQLKGSYKELYCRYDEMLGMYYDYMVVKSGDYYSIIDASGSRLLDMSYKNITPFSPDGLSRTLNEKGEVIYIDKDGLTRVVPNPEYDNLGILIDSRISASLDGKYGYLDEKGEPVTEFKWDNITAYHKAGAAQLDGKWAVIGSKGKEKSEYVYDGVLIDQYGVACYQDRLFMKRNNQYVLVDNKGKEVSDLLFDDARPFTDNGYAAVCKNGKWGFIDADGTLVIDYKYDNAQSFSYGYAPVCAGDRWGYIDTEGNLIIDTVFLDATSFSSEGSVAVKMETEEDDDEGWRLIRLNIAS